MVLTILTGYYYLTTLEDDAIEKISYYAMFGYLGLVSIGIGYQLFKSSKNIEAVDNDTKSGH